MIHIHELCGGLLLLSQSASLLYWVHEGIVANKKERGEVSLLEVGELTGGFFFDFLRKGRHLRRMEKHAAYVRGTTDDPTRQPPLLPLQADSTKTDRYVRCASTAKKTDDCTCTSTDCFREEDD